jgi:hypothetical protein
MLGENLQDLVRRRLWELGRTVEEASRRTRWVISPETFRRLAHRGGRSFISDGLAGHIARALDVPENRVRRVAGLPPVPDPRESIDTRPRLRVIQGGEPDRRTEPTDG